MEASTSTVQPQNSAPRRNRSFSPVDSETWLGSLLIAPAVLYIALLVGVPFLMALYYSVSNTTTGGGSMGFVGLRNFTAVVGTPKFQTALKNTLIFGVISQVLVLILSNALALALQRDFPGKRLIRFLILLPWVAPISIGTIAWLWIFDSTYSVLNWMLRLAGLIQGRGYMWLGLPHLAMGSIIAVHVWRQLPLDPPGHSRRRGGGRRRLLAPFLPGYSAADFADQSGGAAVRFDFHFHRHGDHLQLDPRRAVRHHSGAREPGLL